MQRVRELVRIAGRPLTTWVCPHKINLLARLYLQRRGRLCSATMIVRRGREPNSPTGLSIFVLKRCISQHVSPVPVLRTRAAGRTMDGLLLLSFTGQPCLEACQIVLNRSQINIVIIDSFDLTNDRKKRANIL